MEWINQIRLDGDAVSNLAGLLVFVITFVVWIAQAVTQAKRRRQGQLDGLDEDVVNIDEEEPDELALPRPVLAERETVSPATPKPSPGGQSVDLGELKKQLEDLFGVPMGAPKPTQPARPVQPPVQTVQPVRPVQPTQPVATVTTPKRSAAPLSRSTSGQRAVSTSTVEDGYLQAIRPAVAQPTPAATPSAVFPHPKGPRISRRTSRFPNLHPDPIANAILLAEILKPYDLPWKRIQTKLTTGR
jgi:hypothetical protein